MTDDASRLRRDRDSAIERVRALTAAGDNHVAHPREGTMTIQEQMARDKAGGSTPSRGSTRLGTRPGAKTEKGTKAKSGGSTGTGGSKSTGGSKGSGEREYVRQPPGQANGGQFAPGKARDSSAAEAQKDTGAQKAYSDLMGKSGADAKAYVANLSDKELQNLSKIVYSSKTSDAKVVSSRLSVAAEMSRRGYDVKDFGARGGGTSSNKGKGASSKADASKARSLTQLKSEALKSDNGGIETSGLSDKELQKLIDSGWEGDPTDHREALYPPKKAPSLKMRETLAQWPESWGSKPPRNSPSGAAVVGIQQDGSARYADGYAYDPNSKKFRPND